MITYPDSIDNGDPIKLTEKEIKDLKRLLDEEFGEPQIDTSNECCEQNLKSQVAEWREARERIISYIVKQRDLKR